eukprot:TRINITY_DN779845_c0_g1_i1.p1 TRINITY_DN779845_c0_g1~~TRINITY_DN779845_c0_g1_i1.p1  ORF type:complete len:398 (-),score=110.77 TRINITY_DN779845_c0_g1_i1:77-1270(-)
MNFAQNKMSTPSAIRLVDMASCHAWNADRSMLAISPNDNTVEIYSNCQDVDPKKWVKSFVLDDHKMVVSGIDWHPKTNKIVTCSHDRRVVIYDFNKTTQTWESSYGDGLIRRACLAVKWAPNGKKFAVATADQFIHIGVREKDELGDVVWPIDPKKMAKTSSNIYSILDLAWHPSGDFVGLAYADRQCTVAGGSAQNAKSKSHETFGESKFGSECCVFESESFVESVCWSPNGLRMAFASHDSTVTIVHFPNGAGEEVVRSLVLKCLPVRALLFIDEDTILAGGHDMNPILLRFTGSEWNVIGFIDREEEKKSSKMSAFGSAHKMFQQKTAFGTTSASVLKARNTQHKGTIIQILPHKLSEDGSILSVSSLDEAGSMVLWDVSSVDALAAAVKELTV